jgi:hypothetical protein
MKVWDYFNHTRSCSGYAANLYCAPGSIWNASTPWLTMRHECVEVWNPESYDILFLAGTDWLTYPLDMQMRLGKPIINLIQGLSHADRENPLYAFLGRPAIRICVSKPVAEALHETGRICGPLIVINNCIDHDQLPPGLDSKMPVLLILALKNPALGLMVKQCLEQAGMPVRLQTEPLSRDDYLSLINQYETVCPIPCAEEGFFLPALETMALGSLLVCPDCIGNRAFCKHQFNCVFTEYKAASIVDGCIAAITMAPGERAKLLNGARATVHNHTQERERNEYHQVLRSVHDVWTEHFGRMRHGG